MRREDLEEEEGDMMMETRVEGDVVGTTTQGWRRKASQSWKRKIMDSPQILQKDQAWYHLHLSLRRFISDFHSSEVRR